ncbi:MAG: flagellar basal-body MS-ring/collar protein FliF [Pseudomonadota bacterium]|nr:flagellar basal-body MS-ring/collar protein FliF [Pseudomonadota bacterium]
MATSTTEMQEMQAAERSAETSLSTTAPSGQAGPLGLAKGASLPKLNEILAQPAVKKATPAIMIAVLLVFLVASYMAMQDPVYRPIFPGMTEADRQVASETLKEGGFSPRVNRSTGQLEVDAGSYHEARIFLASKGLPSEGAASGFEALSSSASITTSQFMEQANYAAAVEQELAKSIIRISSITHARVHLALPKQSVFVRDRTPPKASVVVTRFAGRNIDREQVNAIINLVAASIPYLNPTDVVVVDSLGNLLSDETRESPLGLTSAQLVHKQRVETTYRNRIYELLGPIYGENNVRAQVDVELDFTEVESTFETYDPNEKGERTRSEVLSLDRTATADAEGVPGATTNQPPAESEFALDGRATAESFSNMGETVSSRTTRNYELDRIVRTVKDANGQVLKVSVAVAVNRFAPGEYPQPPEGIAPEDFEGPELQEISENELTRVNNLVRGVVNFDAERGDQVTVVATPFDPPAALEDLMPWYENVLLLNMIKGVFAMTVFLLIAYILIRPVAYRLLGIPLPHERKAAEAAAKAAAAEQLAAQPVLGPDGTPLPPGAVGVNENGEPVDANGEIIVPEAEIEIGEGESLEEIRAKLKPKKSAISADLLDTANTYEDKVALIRMLVQEDSGRVANVLKGMVRQR